MKEFLSQRGVQYAEIDVSRDRGAAEEMVRKSGQMGVPVIVADGEVVIGFDRNRLEQILASRRRARPSFGLQVADAAAVAGRFGVSPVPGALVGRVTPSSPGEKLGLAAGDIITEVSSRAVRNAEDLAQALSSLSEGSRVAVIFVRNGTAHKSEIIL